MGIQTLIADAENINGNANRGRTSDKSRPFTPTYREVAVFVINPKGGEGTEVKVVAPNDDSKQYAGFLACIVERSNDRDFPKHRFFYGSLLSNGKFVSYVEPGILDANIGTPVADETFVADHNLHVFAEIWHAGILKDQADAYVENKSGRRDDDRNKPQTVRSPGKTERARAKGKAAKPTHT